VNFCAHGAAGRCAKRARGNLFSRPMSLQAMDTIYIIEKLAFALERDEARRQARWNRSSFSFVERDAWLNRRARNHRKYQTATKGLLARERTVGESRSVPAILRTALRSASTLSHDAEDGILARARDKTKTGRQDILVIQRSRGQPRVASSILNVGEHARVS